MQQTSVYYAKTWLLSVQIVYIVSMTQSHIENLYAQIIIIISILVHSEQCFKTICTYKSYDIYMFNSIFTCPGIDCGSYEEVLAKKGTFATMPRHEFSKGMAN